MGAKPGDMADPRQRQMAREGMRMREERIRQRKEEGASNQAGPAPMVPGMRPGMAPVAGQEQRAAGISFGPGRAMRVPSPDSPEYQQMIERFRRSQG